MKRHPVMPHEQHVVLREELQFAQISDVGKLLFDHLQRFCHLLQGNAARNQFGRRFETDQILESIEGPFFGVNGTRDELDFFPVPETSWGNPEHACRLLYCKIVHFFCNMNYPRPRSYNSILPFTVP